MTRSSVERSRGAPTAEPPIAHPWFAAVYDRMNASMERGFMREVREEIVGGARGRILEVGCGTGASFPHYRDAGDVVAIDPDPHMLERARNKAATLGSLVDIRQAPAEALPFEEGSFDTVIATLVLCTVRDPAQALAEVRRVLRPGGELRFCEHVRLENRLGALVQDALTPLWQLIAAGCHPNRDTVEGIRQAGFEVERLEWVKSAPLPVFVKGVARAEGRGEPQ